VTMEMGDGTPAAAGEVAAAGRVSYLAIRTEPAVVAPIEAALGADQIAVATTGQLIEVLSRLPADTPLTVAQHAQVDADMQINVEEEELLAGIWPVTLWKRTPHGEDRLPRYDSATVGGVEIGACFVAEGNPLPERTVPWSAHERVVAMLHAGDPVGMLDGCRELVDDVAGWLGRDDERLLEWTADAPDLSDQIDVEGRRLAQAAERLALLRDQVAEHLAAQDGTL
jgi:hypothetical protein